MDNSLTLLESIYYRGKYRRDINSCMTLVIMSTLSKLTSLTLLTETQSYLFYGDLVSFVSILCELSHTKYSIHTLYSQHESSAKSYLSQK